jgi:hypothetical protein
VSVIVLACILAGGLLFWLCNELLYFYVAKSYVEELADAYNLNRGLAQAILWASFAAIVVLAGLRLFIFEAEAPSWLSWVAGSRDWAPEPWPL